MHLLTRLGYIFYLSDKLEWTKYLITSSDKAFSMVE